MPKVPLALLKAMSMACKVHSFYRIHYSHERPMYRAALSLHTPCSEPNGDVARLLGMSYSHYTLQLRHRLALHMYYVAILGDERIQSIHNAANLAVQDASHSTHNASVFAACSQCSNIQKSKCMAHSACRTFKGA